MEIRVLARQGKGVRQIARELNVSRNYAPVLTKRPNRVQDAYINRMRLKTFYPSGCAQRTRYGFLPLLCCRSCAHKAT